MKFPASGSIGGLARGIAAPGGSAWAPAQIPGLLVLADASVDLAALADGATVTSWTPGTTNGGAMTGAGGPTVDGAALLSGHRSVQLVSASSQSILSTSGGVPSGADITAAALVRLDATPAATQWLWITGKQAGGQTATGILNNNGHLGGGQFNGGVSTPAALDTSPHLVLMTHDHTTGQLTSWLDGRMATPDGDIPYIAPAAGFGFGTNLNFGTYGDYHAWLGALASGVIADASRFSFERWTWARYGLSVGTNGVVNCVGDSRTYGVDAVTHGTDDLVAQTSAALALLTHGNTATCNNLGVSGELLSTMTASFAISGGGVGRIGLSAVADPFAVVTLFGGVNDIINWSGLATADPATIAAALFADFQSTATQALASGFSLIVVGEPPVFYTGLDLASRTVGTQAALAYNALVKASGLYTVLLDLGNAALFPQLAATTTPTDYTSFSATYWQGDGLHQSVAGVGVIAAALSSAIATLGGMH